MTNDVFPDLRAINRVLIVRLSAIGDVVHALPLASALKAAYPHLEISWLVEEIPADIVIGNPDLSRVIVIPRSRWKRGRTYSPKVWQEYLAFLLRLRQARFDLTIDLQGYAKSAIYILAAGARWRYGWFRLRDGANLVSKRLPRRPESVHRVDWFLDVARALRIEKPSVRFSLAISTDAASHIVSLLSKFGIMENTRFAVINQAAGNLPRRWARMRYAELAVHLIQKHGIAVVMVGTEAEHRQCEEVCLAARKLLETNGLPSHGNGRISGEIVGPVNLAGRTSLRDLTALLSLCVLHVCGDTGSTHIAAALGIPTVALYGSSDPLHAGPWGQPEHVLSHREACSPQCTVRECIYYPLGGTPQSKKLPGDTSKDPLNTDYARCMEQITVAEAVAMVDRVLLETSLSAIPGSREKVLSEPR